MLKDLWVRLFLVMPGVMAKNTNGREGLSLISEIISNINTNIRLPKLISTTYLDAMILKRVKDCDLHDLLVSFMSSSNWMSVVG